MTFPEGHCDPLQTEHLQAQSSGPLVCTFKWVPCLVPINNLLLRAANGASPFITVLLQAEYDNCICYTGIQK